MSPTRATPPPACAMREDEGAVTYCSFIELEGTSVVRRVKHYAASLTHGVM
jgi:hypothetical protein